MVAGRQGHHDRRRGGHARTENESFGPLLQGRDQGLELLIGRVFIASVAAVAELFVILVARIIGRQMDRRHNRVGRRVQPPQGLGRHGGGFEGFIVV